MKLKFVRIRGFRSIKDQRLDFNNNCQFLVGINESGKTNILRALRLLDPDTMPNTRDKRVALNTEQRDGTKEIHFEFEITRSELKIYLESVLSKFLCANIDSAILCRKGEKEYTVIEYSELHHRPLLWIDMDKLTRHFGGYKVPIDALSKEWKKRKKDFDVDIVGTDGITFNSKKYDWIHLPSCPEFPVEGLEDASPEDLSTPFISGLTQHFKSKTPRCVYWTYKPEYLLPASINIEAFANDPASCVPLQQIFHLAGISDIKKSIDEERALGSSYFRNLLERVADRATDHVTSIWKEYRQVKIKLEPNGDSIDASVIDHFNRFDFESRSDGFKRFLSLLLTLSAQTKTKNLENCVILLDEAENALHPSGVRYLRDELIRISETNLVVASTHSIFMIDKAKIDRHLIVKKTKEITELTRVDRTNILEEEVIYNALNYSVFESLKSFNLIFEGWRDKAIFDFCLPHLKKQDNDTFKKLSVLGLCHLQGVNDVGRVIPILELAQRRYAIISDSDNAAVQGKKKFKGSGAWSTYTDLGFDQKTYLTSEDFLIPKKLNNAIASYANSRQKTTFTLIQNKPYINQIQSWLQRECELEKDALREALDDFKTKAITDLTIDDIKVEYFEMLKLLADQVPTTQE